MCDGYAEGPEAWRSIWRKSRKEHRCLACREPIRKGDRYRYSSGIWDGEPNSYKHCARCWTMFEAIDDRTSDPIDLRLDCGEIWENPPEHVAELAFALPQDFAEARA